MAELVLQEETEIVRSHPRTPVVPTREELVEETPSKKTSIASGRVSKVSTRRPRQMSSITHKSAYDTASEQEDNTDSIVKFQVSKSGKKAPLQSVYNPEWESVYTSLGADYTPKTTVFGKPTPTPIPSSQRVRIEGSVKAGKVREHQLKLSHEKVKAEFLRTIRKSLPSSQNPTDTHMPAVEETLHPHEVFEPETPAPRTTRSTREVQEAPESSSSKPQKPSPEDFNELITTLNDAFNSTEAEFSKQNKAHEDIVRKAEAASSELKGQLGLINT